MRTTAPQATDWFARYQAVRRPVEVGFWLVAVGVQCVLNTLVALADSRYRLAQVPAWEPVVWELTSHAMVLALIPALVAFERRFALHLDTWRANLPWHLLASVAFSVTHVAGMVALRHLVYAAAGAHYEPGAWLAYWAYEYLKDIRAYLLIVGTLMAYRHLMLRWQGEARVLDPPEPPVQPPPELGAVAQPAQVADETGRLAPGTADPAPSPGGEPVRPQRFLVRKLRREFLIAATDIAWVQAQGNYVGLRVNGHDYLLRSTLGDFLGRLDPVRFVQVHRSHVVNLDLLAEIEPLDSGDARLRMRDGSVVPCSRRYRQALTGGVGGSPDGTGERTGAQ